MTGKAVSSEHLQVLGKHASTLFQSQKVASMNDAVLRAVQDEHLNAHQVRRVIEFANVDAFQAKHASMSGDKIVVFPGGPADPNVVLGKLNATEKVAAVYDLSDYDGPPSQSYTPEAAALGDRLVEQMFKTASAEKEPVSLKSVWDLRDKLAGARDHLESELMGLEGDIHYTLDNLYENVKEAHAEGVTMGQMLNSWSRASAYVPAPAYAHAGIKLACSFIIPKLMNDSVFYSKEELATSFSKTAAVGLVNVQHPVVSNLLKVASLLQKTATHRAALEEITSQYKKIDDAVKEAAIRGRQFEDLGSAMESAKGIIPKAYRAADFIAPHTGAAARSAVDLLAGEGSSLGKGVGSVTDWATRNAPTLAGLAVANAAYNSAPGRRLAYNINSRLNPLSQAYQQREQNLAMMDMQQAQQDIPYFY